MIIDKIIKCEKCECKINRLNDHVTIIDCNLAMNRTLKLYRQLVRNVHAQLAFGNPNNTQIAEMLLYIDDFYKKDL